GGFMLFPFFSLYLSKRFEVGMVEVGFLFTFFSLGAIFGGTFGGLLTDKYGRKSTMLLGLIASGLGSIAMAFAETLIIFYILAIISGLLGMVGDPARSAMVADLLPPEKQADGFGVLRIAINLSAAIGPAIGGIVAGYGFNYIFFADAASSLITAVIVIVVIKETKPKILEKTKSESIWKTFEGYKSVLKDRIFMFFLLINIFLSLAYLQLYSTLSVFLIDNHEFSEQNYGLLISLNALIVVLFQFPLTRKISRNKPFVMMGVGAIFYAIGFGMIGFVSSHYLFFVAIIIITIGEMIIAPFGRSLVAKFASEDKRGRYMAVFGLSWG
ncbi:MAG: MFS transporter, partial [archaeon]|nr:MFS transporter [archaeon]